MKEEQLKAIQDSLFELGQKFVLEEGECPQLGFMITGAGSEEGILDGSKKFGLVQIEGQGEEIKPEEKAYSVVAVNMQPPDEQLLQHYIGLAPDSEPFIMQLLKDGMEIFGLSEAKAIHHTLNVLLQRAGGNRKDLVAVMVRELCEKSKAFAFIHVVQLYSLMLDSPEERKNHPADLSEDPASKEVLVATMETYNFYRTLKAAIKREPDASGAARDTGKVVGLVDFDENIHRGDFSQKGFRFSGVLSPAD
jgi:hypothetical protein